METTHEINQIINSYDLILVQESNTTAKILYCVLQSRIVAEVLLLGFD